LSTSDPSASGQADSTQRPDTVGAVRFDGSERETCERCGFDSRSWERPDASAFFNELGAWWHLVASDFSEEDLDRRPAPGVWSALEYGLHSAVVLPILRAAIEVILTRRRQGARSVARRRH
jgi:hypothetical protein